MLLVEQIKSDVDTIKRNGMLSGEGCHDSDIFSLLIRAIELGKNTQLETSAIAEVLFEKLVNRGLKTRDYAVINGYLITSDRDGNHYCDDQFFSSKNELKTIIYDPLDEYGISINYADHIVDNIFDYLKIRFELPR